MLGAKWRKYDQRGKKKPAKKPVKAQSKSPAKAERKSRKPKGKQGEEAVFVKLGRVHRWRQRMTQRDQEKGRAREPLSYSAEAPSLFDGDFMEATEKERVALLKQQIDAMSHYDLCRRWRFLQAGDPFFQGEVGRYFSDKLFKEKGGFTPEISKQIGWDGSPR